MITEDRTETIEFLASPVTHGGATVERIETHASMVFVTGPRAFKLKRAVRYDYLDFMTQNLANEREFATTTLGIQYFINPVTRIICNYEWRRMKVSNPDAIAAGAARDNALAIAANLGDRASLQLTWSF